MTETKAQEFIKLMRKRYHMPDAQDFYERFANLSDSDWREIMDVILTNRLKDENMDAFKMPSYDKIERDILMYMIWSNDKCGLHNSYYSRMWWMAKGGPLIKSFPVNALLQEFEAGKRKANHTVYRNR